MGESGPNKLGTPHQILLPKSVLKSGEFPIPFRSCYNGRNGTIVLETLEGAIYG